MKSLSRILLLAITLFASLVWAEGPCPAGQRMVGQQNVPGASYPICQPIAGYSNAPAQPRAVWADRWGAIVSDFATGAVGTSTGRTSRSVAIETAMQDCAAAGGKSCELNLTYNNQCAAWAWGPGKGGKMISVGDPTKSGAEQNAVDKCKSASGSSCELFYSACSYAERIQ